MRKLTPTQLDLVKAMQTGNIRVHFVPYMGRFNPNAYYFRSDRIGTRCTRDAEGLICRGLARRTNERHACLVLTEAGLAFGKDTEK